jgi:AraC family transcriptional regulator
MAGRISTDAFKPVRIGRLGQRVVVGIDGRYDLISRSAIPAQWAAYGARPGYDHGMVPDGAYGVCHTAAADGSFGYLCGMQLSKGERVPDGLASITVPSGNYAKFACPGHISEMAHQWERIYAEWQPGSGYEITDGPSVEFYGAGFDPATGSGGFEIWVPVRKTT